MTEEEKKEGPKIHVDEDWKQKAEAAADELAHGQARMTEEIDLG